jgi:hypothetical protein
MIINTNTMNYKIIKDENAFKHFVNSILPDTDNNEKFYVALFARKKYNQNSTFRADKAQLKRILTTKERILNDVKKLEVSTGLYTIEDQPVPNKMMALYINPNPRDMHKAGLNMMVDMTKLLRDGKPLNPKTLGMNACQVSTSNKKYFNIDIDILYPAKKKFNDSILVNWLESGNFVNKEALTVVKTRGGYHILVELKSIAPEYKNKWYQGFRYERLDEYFDVDMSNGDGLLPVVGCNQGGFIPKIVKI